MRGFWQDITTVAPLAGSDVGTEQSVTPQSRMGAKHPLLDIILVSLG